MNKWGLPSAALPARHREPPRPPSAAPQAMPGGLRRGGRVKGWPSRQGGMASPLSAPLCGTYESLRLVQNSGINQLKSQHFRSVLVFPLLCAGCRHKRVDEKI